jgi:hypothetical protein
LSEITLKRNNDLIWECFTSWSIHCAPVKTHRFCGPLDPRRMEESMTLMPKVRKDDKVKSKKTDIAEYRKIKVQYVDARVAIEDANNVFTVLMKACDVDPEKAFDCLFDRMSEDMLNRAMVDVKTSNDENHRINHVADVFFEETFRNINDLTESLAKVKHACYTAFQCLCIS